VTAYRVASRIAFCNVAQRNIINPKSVIANTSANVGKNVNADSIITLPPDRRLRRSDTAILDAIALYLGLLLRTKLHTHRCVGTFPFPAKAKRNIAPVPGWILKIFLVIEYEHKTVATTGQIP
jgi:hypothetical protein